MDSFLTSTPDPDPSRLDDLLHLFELDAYTSWAAMEAEARRHEAAADKAMREAEDYLDSLVGAAMDDLHRSFDKMDRVAEEELSRALSAGRAAERSVRATAAVASMKYADRVVASADAAARPGKRGARGSGSKVRPC